MYVNISVQNIEDVIRLRLCCQSADLRIIVSWVRALSGTGVSVGDRSSDPGSAHLILKVDHCRLNLICSSLFQL